MPGFGHYVEQDQVTQVPTEIADPKKNIANPKLATKMVNMLHILMNFSWVGRGTWKNYITTLAKTYTIKLLKQGLQYPEKLWFQEVVL